VGRNRPNPPSRCPSESLKGHHIPLLDLIFHLSLTCLRQVYGDRRWRLRVQFCTIEIPPMDLLPNGTRPTTQDLIRFLFDSAADLLQWLDNFLGDGVTHRSLAQELNQLGAAGDWEKEQQAKCRPEHA